MDGLLKKGKELLNKSKGGSGGHNTAATGGAPGQGGAQTQDYGDKAINSIQAKFGIDKDGKYNKYEEKGSDMLRGQFEKSSGKNIPDKFSN